MLHLQAAIQSYSCSIPEVWPSCPLFVPGYRHKESGNDRQIIYTLTESSEPFLSPQEAAAIGEVGLLRTLISNSNNINGWDDRFQKTALHRGVIGGHENAAELLISEGADINAGEITPLQLAIMNGHKDIAELLISEGADIDVKDDSGNTLLHLAAQKGLREVIGTLIAKNIDINAKNSNGQTPAHLAVQGRQQAIVKLLLEKGADITAKDNDGNTLLILACQGRRWAIAQDLVEAGAHVNQAGKDGQTPLHLAVARGPKDLIELLLNKGANVNARDEQGRTALHLVVPRGNRDLVELLLTHGADVNAQDKQAGTPALHALNVWKLDVVDLLIKSGADVTNPYLAAYTGNMSGIQNVLNSDSGVADYKGLTLLHTAAAGGQIELVNFLIGRGLDVKASTEDGLVPLHYAAMGNHQEVANILITHGAPVDSGEQTPLLVAADAGHKDMVKFLISKGADINKGPQTALHTEVDWWDIDAVKLLLELGADVNAQNDVGNTPLHAAVNTWWLEVAEVLLAQGAKIDMKNNQGQTPLLMAADDGFTQMVRLLVDKGANIHAKDNQGRTTLDIAIEQDNKEITQWLESKGAKSSEPGDGKNILHRSAANSTAKEFKAMFTQTLDISLRDAKDNNGFTPLHCAIQFWRTGNAKLLIDKGADLNVQDNEGYTPLHLAAWQGMKDMAELLIDRGANLNTQDNWGWTPLHRAVIAKQQDIAKLLIDEGADINIKDKEGRTALWWAEDLELEDTTELLKQTNQRKVEAATISKSKESKPVRGIAITAISAASTCKQGDTIPITVSLTNQGTRREAFHVTLAEDITGKEITSKELTLAKGWKDGSEGVADLIFNAESDETNYMGQRVCAEGDVNGDGYNDVLVTADGWNDNQGRAYLYYGGAELSSSPDKIFTGVSVGDHFGDASGDFGDVNNDNYDDVIIGARGHNANDGYVHIFYGGPDMDEIPDLTLLGEAGAGAYFGLIVSSGDVDGDDFDDVLVTGVGFDNGRGRAYLYHGGNPMDTAVDLIFDGENTGDWFGRHACIGGDVNGDTFNDFIISARQYDPVGGTDLYGRAYLYYGAARAGMNNVCDKIFTGEQKTDEFGSGLDLFDIDDDHFADVIIGARAAQNYRGRAYLYWGETSLDDSTPDVCFEGEPGANLGGDNLKAGYLNNDNYGDIAIGAYNYPDASTRRGRVYVFYGGTQDDVINVCDLIFDGENEAGFQYFCIEVSLGDVNNDSYDELVVGAWGHSNNRGRAYLYYGPFSNTEDLTFNWDTTNATPGKHTLKASIAPVAGEEDVADNSVTVTIEVKERQQ